VFVYFCLICAFCTTGVLTVELAQEGTKDLLLLLLYDMNVSCHRHPFLPGTSLEPAVIPTAQASSFTLQ